jgi:hypothetical protein
MNEKLLFSHVKNIYPDEWEKFNITKMGVKPYQVLPELLENSIKQGFLSKQNDSLLIKLHMKFKLFRFLLLVLFLISIICLTRT